MSILKRKVKLISHAFEIYPGNDVIAVIDEHKIKQRLVPSVVERPLDINISASHLKEFVNVKIQILICLKYNIQILTKI